MPKPKELEELQGNPGHRKINNKAPVPDTNIPPPPRWLGKISARAYYDIVELVGPNGMNVMGKSDRMALIMLCEAFQEWRDCKRKLELGEEAERLIKNDPDNRKKYFSEVDFEYFNGGVSRYYTSVKAGTITTKRHPVVDDMKDAWGRVMTALGKFGMTPYERQKVSVIAGLKDKPVSREDEIATRRAALISGAQNKNHVKVV